jgi:DNA repair protein RAD16
MTVAVDLRGLDDGEDGEEGEAGPALCVICMDKPMDAVLLDCGHMYTCMDCVKKLDSRTCPVCRKPIKKVIKSTSEPPSAPRVSGPGDDGGGRGVIKFGRKSIVQNINLAEFASSTKISAVVAAITAMRATEPDAKAIVFSQYVNMLDLVEWSLHKKGIKCVNYQGSLPMNQRRSILQAFNQQDQITVILISLKAGGEGLNLQRASHVFILDPWWNPAVEAQAIQRAHRIGQKKKVTAVRFITKDTIEERMLQLQEKKALVFEGTVGSSAQALSSLTQEDLAFLFKN